MLNLKNKGGFERLVGSEVRWQGLERGWDIPITLRGGLERGREMVGLSKVCCRGLDFDFVFGVPVQGVGLNRETYSIRVVDWLEEVC